MKIEELIEDALNKYFTDYKDYHLIILIAFVVIIAILQIAQGLWVNERINKFKSALKKSEIKFSKFSEMQIEALNEIFEMLTDFRQISLLTDKKLNTSSPELTKKITEKWLVTYNYVYSTFSKKRHILPKDIKQKFASILTELEKAGKYVKSEKDLSAMFNTWSNGEVDFMGDEEERYKLEMDVKTYKEDGLLKGTVKNINEIRKQIEKYFETIK